MQHRDGDDEGEVEPVGDVDVRLLALQDRAEEDDADRRPRRSVSQRSTYHSGSAYSRALGDAEQVAGRGQHDEELVAPEDEPGEVAAEQPRAAGALHDVEGGGDQRVAAEGEDHRRGVQRPQPAEVDPGLEVELGKASCERDEDADEEADDAPEHGGDRRRSGSARPCRANSSADGAARREVVLRIMTIVPPSSTKNSTHMCARKRSSAAKAAPISARNAARATPTISAPYFID